MNCGGREEKAEQIRLYSGDSFTMTGEAEAGTVCAVTGLTGTYAGQGLGEEAQSEDIKPLLLPAITSRIIMSPDTDPVVFLSKLRQLEEEDPTMRVLWKEEVKEIHVQIMGELEEEILKTRIKDRFGEDVSFGESGIIYKETIAEPVIGIGHYEPLRHYAEVQLLLEPLPPGSGLVIGSLCSEESLDRNWQRLILAHLGERPFPGVLAGSEITDMKISILAGRAHLKHTEGGDFRQATYRAVRQGLRKAKSVLLEPFYSFSLKVPQDCVGRAMSDMQRLGASCGLPEIDGMMNNVIEGEGPVATLKGYQREVSAYTKGEGRFEAALCGFRPCHNADEVVANSAYVPEADLENPTGSVFCSRGAAEYVDWKQVDEMAHVDSGYIIENGHFIRRSDRTGTYGGALLQDGSKDGSNTDREKLSAAGEKELLAIFERTYGKSKRDEALRKEALSKATHSKAAGRSDTFPQPKWKHETGNGQPFLVIDGYNVIFAWDEFASNPLQIINLRTGGLAIYGGVIGGILTCIIYTRIKKLSFWLVADTSVAGLITGQIIGRWGNFFNKEAFGSYTDNLLAMRLPWDEARLHMSSDSVAELSKYVTDGYIQVHPTFLYESLWNLAVLVFLLLYTKHKKFDGELFFIYLAGYGLGRVWIEGLRTDQLRIWGTSIAVSQILALVMAVGSISFIIYKRRKIMKNKPL